MNMNKILTIILIFQGFFAFCQTFIRDDLNRITKVEYSDGSYIEYTYDKLGNVLNKVVNPCINKVFNTTDSGPGSLRRAVECAVHGDTIFFENNLIGQKIILSSSKLILSKNLVFKQPQNGVVKIESSFNGTVFHINQGVNIYIEYIDLYGGSNSNGRAIYNAGNLVLKNVNIFDDLIGLGGSTILNEQGSTLLLQGFTNIIK